MSVSSSWPYWSAVTTGGSKPYLLVLLPAVCPHTVPRMTFLYPNLNPALKCIHHQWQGHEGVVGVLRYQCSQRAAVRGLEPADLACGLREPQQLKASELYKYYHMSRCHVGGRVGGIETFGLCCLAHKVPHKRPSVCLCHSQLPHTHSSAPISAFPAGTLVPPGVNLRGWGWGGGESKPPAKCGSCSSALLFL